VLAADRVARDRQVDDAVVVGPPEVDQPRGRAEADTEPVDRVAELGVTLGEKPRAKPPRAGGVVGGDPHDAIADRGGGGRISKLARQHVR
jgi:hypothetical protein